MSVAAATMAELPVAAIESRPRVVASAVACWGVCIWVLAAPFEGVRPLVHLPGQSLSSVEAALLAVFGVWGAALAYAALSARSARTFVTALRTPFTIPWLVFLAAASAAALLAPTERANAVHMAGRFGLAFGVFLVTVNGITTRVRLLRVFVAAAAVGGVISIIAALEFIGVAPVLRALTEFRAGVAVVGSQVRAAGPFQYPTIASMYLEILFAFTLALIPIAMDDGRRGTALSAGVVVAAIAEAITLTFTRAGLITIAASLLIVGGLRWRQRRFDTGVKAIAALAVVIGIELLTSRSMDVVRLRMTTEGQENWYHASIDAPLDLAFATGATTTVAVTLINTGLTTWDSSAAHPYRLAYHWILSDENRAVNYEGLRTEFDQPVPPGATVTVFARVRAPGQPGRYRLMWDLVQEGRLWFSTEPDAELVITRALVSGPATGPLASSRIVPIPASRVRPGRLVLWRAARRMFLDHPLTGVGPDNFRLLYGPYAGLANPDSRVHTNNMYLELLVGGGIFAAAAAAWLFLRVFALLRRGVRGSGDGDMTMPTAAVAAACAAIAIHGTVDSFFSFTATYVLFAVTLGLAVACATLTFPHAHRV